MTSYDMTVPPIAMEAGLGEVTAAARVAGCIHGPRVARRAILGGIRGRVRCLGVVRTDDVTALQSVGGGALGVGSGRTTGHRLTRARPGRTGTRILTQRAVECRTTGIPGSETLPALQRASSIATSCLNEEQINELKTISTKLRKWIWCSMPED